MPAPGLTKALEEAVLKGAKGAKVVRPAEKLLLEKEAEAAAKKAAAEAPAPAAEAPAAAEVKPVEQPAVQPATKERIDPTVSEKPPEAAVLEDPTVPTKMPEEVPPGRELPPAAEPVEATAGRLSEAKLGNYALDEVHMPNFERITTTDEVKAVIADIAQQNVAKIDTARRGIITNEQLAGLAADLDTSQDVVKRVIEREAGGVLNPETILAARQLLNSSADRVKALADKVAVGQATDIEKVQFARQVQFHTAYQAQFMGARAEAGRALNAFNIPIGTDAVRASRIAEIISNSGGDIERLARAVHLADSTEGVTKAITLGLPRRVGAAAMHLINRVFVNGILSGPTTHFINMLGNTIFPSMNVVELAVAARLGKFLPGEEHVVAGEALATLHGTLGATMDAWRLFGRALKSGQSLDGVLKYEITGGAKGTTLERLPELDKPYLGRLIQGIDAVIDAPTRVLGAEDDLFKTLAYRAYTERQAMKHVQDQFAAGTLKLEDAAQEARNFMENTPEQTQKAAEDWAADMTFQTPLGPAGQKFQAALRSVPVLTLIAPFIRTPVNIFKQAAYRSPMAVFSQKFWADIAAGGAARDLALTRFAMGSGTAALVGYLASEGGLTGAGPQNPKARQLWLQNGNQPYSVKAVNPTTGEATWHSYARMEPFASIVGATADAVEIGSYVNEDPESMTDQDAQLQQAAGAIIAGIMNNTGNKTFMKGVADFMEFTSDPGRFVQSYSNQMALSMVPYSALIRTVRNLDDPYLREAWTLTDKLRDNTPGYSDKLPLRLDLFGEIREKSHSTLLGAMSPIPETTAKSDPVVTEMLDLMTATHQVPAVMPSKRVEGMRLTAAEYSDIVRLSRSEPVFGGMSYYDKLDQTINSAEYQRLSPTMRVEVLKKLQSNADTIGRAKLEKENPDFADRITEWRMDKARLRTNN